MTQAQVLVVEDESIVARALQQDLTSMGYEVPVVAASGEEAIARAGETAPDLLLMDIVLKGDMDGIEASRKIREQLDIPVVYLTAYEDAETLKRARATQPFGYLLKPYEERELHATIEMALHKHRMERQLRETEQSLAATLNSIRDGVITTDARHAIRLVNPAAEQLTGWSRADAAGKLLPEVLRLRQAQNPEAPGSDFEAPISEFELPRPSLLRTRAGADLPVECSVSAIRDPLGQVTGFVWTFRDISERVRLEQLARQRDEQLRHSQKMEAIGRLASGVAQDFNNLLTVILGNVSLLLGTLPRKDPSFARLTTIETAALRAAELVEQLQCFSGRTPLHLEPTNLNTTLQDGVGIVRSISDSTIAIEARPGPRLWTVQADPNQLSELVLNLCFNAREAMPSGGHLLVETANVVVQEEECQTRPQARPGEYVRLRVQDSGQGMTADVQTRMFEPFFTTRTSRKAAGLGLALAFGIVEQHHGWVECQSAVGQGTRFDVYLPRYGHERLIEPAPVTPRAPIEESRTILLADEEPMIRDLGRIILEGRGYEVLLACDGVDAVDIYQRESHRIDLVILDLTMPRLSGWDAFRHLQEINPAVRVCFSTGHGGGELPERDPRILGVIRKPYRPEELCDTVRTALEQPVGPRKDKLLLLLNRLERVLARANSTGDWLDQVGDTLNRIEEVLQQHCADSEAFDGLFAEVDRTRPSLARQVNDMYQRCTDFLVEAGDLQREVQARATTPDPDNGSADLSLLRRRLRQFLVGLQKHREEEMDLIFESVTTEIGAGD